MQQWRIICFGCSQPSIACPSLSLQRAAQPKTRDRTYPKTFLLAECCLYLDRIRVIVRHEPTVSTDALRRNTALVDLFLGASSREIFVLERAILSSDALELLPRSSGMEETAAEQGDPE